MTASVAYVRTRDGVYQYERRVPLRIQRDHRRFADLFGSKPLFRRSLGTKDQSAMFTAARTVHDEFERLVRGGGDVMGNGNITVVAAPAAATRMVTDEDLKAIAQRRYDLIVQPLERLYRRANVDAAAAAELKRMEHQLELDGESIRATLRTPYDAPDGPVLRPADEARHIVSDHGFIAPDGSDALGAIIGAVRLGMEQGYQHVSRLMSGDTAPPIGIMAEARTERMTLTLAAAVERYLAERQVPAKAASETRLALRQFERIAGNKLLSAVTRDDMISFVRSLADHSVGGKSTGSVVRHLSAHTIGKRLRMLSGAISFAKDAGFLDGGNPAQGIKVASFVKPVDKRVMPDKRRFQVSELNRIFAHPWFTGCKGPNEKHLPGDHHLHGAYYWVPIVAVLTGCRAGELGGMKLIDVRLDDPHPHFVIRPNEYRRIKNDRSRCVPILDALLDLGFAAYVKAVAASGADRLFPDWTARKAKSGDDAGYPAWSNGNIPRAFNRTVVPWALSEQMQDGARRDLTFHSMRGAFKALLSNKYNLPINVVHEVIGHAKTELDMRYIGQVTIEETFPMVRACRYETLNIPKGRQGVMKIPSTK